MAHIQPPDRVKETTNTTGTGTVSLDASSAAYRRFGDVCANGDTIFYCIAHQSAAEWEVGLGTWGTGHTLARTAILKSSNSNAAVSFSAGTKDVFATVPADRTVMLDHEQAARLPAISAPSAPDSGLMSLYARSKAGLIVPHHLAADGAALQLLSMALFRGNSALWLPGTGTTVAINFGSSFTARNGTGAQSHPAQASTNLYTAMRRAEFAAGAVSGQSSGIQTSVQSWLRGNASGLGGFYWSSRIGVPSGGGTSGSRFFNGLTTQNATWNSDPSSVNNTCGLAADAADTNWQILTRDGTTASKLDTGLAKTTTGANSILDFEMFCPPNGSSITFRLVQVATGTVLVDNVARTANLPTNTQLLYMWANANSSAAAASTLALNHMFCTSLQ